MIDKVEFKLSGDGIEYGLEGLGKVATFIELRCPNLKDKKAALYHRKLKGFLGKTLLKLSGDVDGKENDADGEPDVEVKAGMSGNQMAMLLCAYGDDYPEQVAGFEKVCHLHCFLNGDAPLDTGPRDRMGADEFDALFGTFCVNFTMPSLLKIMSGKK